MEASRKPAPVVQEPSTGVLNLEPPMAHGERVMTRCWPQNPCDICAVIGATTSALAQLLVCRTQLYLRINSGNAPTKRSGLISD